MKTKLLLCFLLLSSVFSFGQYINKYNDTNAALKKQDDRAKERAADYARQPNTPSNRANNTPFEWNGPLPYLLQSKEQRAAAEAAQNAISQARYKREQDRIQHEKDWLQQIDNENFQTKRNYINLYINPLQRQKAFTELELNIIGEEMFYFSNYDEKNKDYINAGAFVKKLRLATMKEPLDTLVQYIWNARLWTDFSLNHLKKLQTAYPDKKSYLERNELMILANYFGSNTKFEDTNLGYIYPQSGFELMNDKQKTTVLDRFEELETLYPETAKVAAGQCRVGFNMFYKYATSNLPLKNKTDSKRLEYLYKTLETVQPARILSADGLAASAMKRMANNYLRGTAIELKLIYPDFIQTISPEKWRAISDAYQLNIEYVAWAFRDNDYDYERFFKKYPNLVAARKKEFANEKSDNSEVTFKNRDKYKGQLKDGVPNGIGIYTTASGDRSEGNFVDGKLNGPGKQNFRNGNVFEGNFKDGNLDGKGKTYHAEKTTESTGATFIWDGDSYTGEFKNGRRHGKGSLTNKDRFNQIYDGDWKNNKRDGYGEDSFVYRTVTNTYKGQYQNDNSHGYGEYKNSNGISYIGNFKEGKYDGKGILKDEKEIKYEGDWEKNKINGNAKCTTANGYVKTYKNEYEKKYQKYNERNVKYFNPDGKEITEAEYNQSK